MEKTRFRKATAFAAAFLLTVASICSTGTDLQQNAMLTASAINQTETFSITNESFSSYGKLSGYGNSNFYVVTTERNDKTGNIGTVRTENSTNNTFVHESVFRDTDELTYDVEPDSQVYLWVGSGNHTLLYTYDTETKKTVKSFSITGRVTLSEELFPEGVGCSKVKIYGRGVARDKETSILGKEVGSGLEYTAEEFAIGKAVFSYELETTIGLEEDFTNLCQVIFEFEDGSKVEYVVIGDTAYINEDTRPATPLLDAEGNPKTDSKGNELVKGSDENGNPIVSDETLKSPAVEGNSHVRIYEGANEIEKMTYAEYVKGKYVIKDYDPEKNYYVRLGLDINDEHSIFYKYDKNLDAWVERLNTKETPQYEISINPFTFPNEMAEGDVGDTSGVGKTVAKWKKEEFCKSFSFTMDTVKSDAYKISFYGDSDNVSQYKLIGIDPERVSGTPTGEMSSIPVEMPPLSSGTLHGETEDGDILDFEFECPDKNEDGEIDDDFFLMLPDGSYHVEGGNGLYDDFIVDKDGSQGKEDSIGDNGLLQSGDPSYPNLKTPEDVNSYKITDPSGNPVDEGELKDGILDRTDDLNLSGDELKEKGKYFYYETEVGVKNSTDTEAFQKEFGCFTVEEDGTLKKEILSSNLKGDVNMDSEVTVADVIMLQKYLLKTEPFTLGNYVNADTYVDGDVDIFDIAMLKRDIVNNNK